MLLWRRFFRHRHVADVLIAGTEYGKPCVAGIERVLTRFEDGQVVEVDGSSGRVRLVED